MVTQYHDSKTMGISGWSQDVSADAQISLTYNAIFISVGYKMIEGLQIMVVFAYTVKNVFKNINTEKWEFPVYTFAA